MKFNDAKFFLVLLLIIKQHNTIIDASANTVPYTKLEIRSVERGICPIAKSTMNEMFQ